MGFHHVALATPNIEATHRFYTEAMGFELVKAVLAPTPEGGWAKHVFYETGGHGMIAFWDLHVDSLPPVNGAISRGLGLPEWVNHLAFDAPDEAAITSALERWAALGLGALGRPAYPQLRGLADTCPANFAARALLVAAAHDMARGRDDEAVDMLARAAAT